MVCHDQPFSGRAASRLWSLQQVEDAVAGLYGGKIELDPDPSFQYNLYRSRPVRVPLIRSRMDKVEVAARRERLPVNYGGVILSD